MSENITTAVETTVVEGQMDLFTGEMVETEAPELTLKEIVTEVVSEVFGTDTEVTAFKVIKAVNNVFTATMTDKQVPSQMGYNYTRNGMIAKGKRGSGSTVRYTKDEVEAFVLKYTTKHVNI